MTKNSKKTVFRDSGSGQFISMGQAARKPRNTWHRERCRVGMRIGKFGVDGIEDSVFIRAGTKTSRSASLTPLAWRKIEENESLERIELKIDRLEECIDTLSERIYERY